MISFDQAKRDPQSPSIRRLHRRHEPVLATTLETHILMPTRERSASNVGTTLPAQFNLLEAEPASPDPTASPSVPENDVSRCTFSSYKSQIDILP